jgi:hypothetical protein
MKVEIDHLLQKANSGENIDYKIKSNVIISFKTLINNLIIKVLRSCILFQINHYMIKIIYLSH